MSEFKDGGIIEARDVEVLDAAPLVHVASVLPFSVDRKLLDVAEGPTIAELLVQIGVPAWAETRVYVGEAYVPPSMYARVRPRRGATVTVRAVPRGGGGGSGQGKNIGLIVAGILLIVAAIVIALVPGLNAIAGAAIPYLVSAGVGLILSGIINLLIPPPTVPRLRPLSSGSSDAESPTLSIAGQQNDARPYGVVPALLGRHKIFPPYAAAAFTEIVGADQYLRLLFCTGIGPVDISDLKLGDTPIENFIGPEPGFPNVETEIRTGAAGEPPITLYTNDVTEDPLSVVLSFAGGPQIRTSRIGARELSVAFVFPQGLVRFVGSGTKEVVTVSLDVEYRLVGQTAWIKAAGSPVVTSEARQAIVRAGLRWLPVVLPTSLFGAAFWSQFGFASVTLSRFNDGVLNVAAFDADAAAAGSWLLFDSGVGLARSFGRVVVTSAGSGANATWDIQCSDDQVEWTTVFSGFSTGAAGTESAEWAAPATPIRFWRLLKTNGAVAGPDYYEVQFWEAVPAANIAAQFDVRVTRTTADAVDPNQLDIVGWAALRTFKASPPVTLAGVGLVAMRIKATDTLNGIVSNFNCIANRKHLDYATYAGSVNSERPLGYWRLGEIAGAPTAFDASGNGRSGTYQGSPVLGAAGLLVGDADTAMTFDATNDAVTSFAGLSAIDMGAMSFTFECLFKTTSVAGGTTRSIVAKGSGDVFTNGPVGWGVRQNDATIQFARNSGGGAPTISTTSGSITANTTYHLVVRYNYASGQVVISLNGADVATTSVGAVAYADTYDLNVGRNPAGSFWSGTLDEVSIAPSSISDARRTAHYNASLGTREWVVQSTSNPASIYRAILQDAGNARPVPDARIDLPEIQAWHAECDSGGRSCNLVVDYKTTIFELLRVVASCGRGTPTTNDGKYAAVRDLAQTVPRQHFTPRNTRGFKGHRALVDPLHGLKMRFVDPSANWQQGERLVLADGYSEFGEVPGTVAGTNYGVIELHGVTDPDLAWRIGRYTLAVSRLRPENYEFETDVEHLVARRGDLVRVAHDVPEWGLSQGRVKSVATSGGNATTATLDEPVVMVGGTSYAVRFRLADGTSVVANVVTAAGTQSTLTFVSPIAPPIPAAGDLFMFGVVGTESIEAIVSRIAPGPEMSAVLTLVDAAPAVLTADQGAIPPWDPQMTRPAPNELVPPTPVVTSVVSDETVLLRGLDGSLTSRIVVALDYVATSNLRADYLEVRWRRSDSSMPFDQLPQLPPDAPSVAIDPVEDGIAYDVRIRTVNREGPTSPWAEVLGHVVVGKTSAPPAPENPRMEGNKLFWDYPNPPLDFNDGFEVRRSPGSEGNWMTALEMHVGLVPGPFDVGTIYGVWTLLVAAVDTSGNASDPASLTVDFGTPPLHNTVASKDYDADGYPGSITNGSVSGGDLKADQLTTGFWTQDGNLFWSTNGSTLFWQGTYKELTYDFAYTTGSNAGGASIVFYPVTIVGVGWSLSYRVGSSGDYLPWPGILPDILASQEYDFRLVVYAGVVQGVVSGLTLIVDAEDVEEQQQSVTIAATTGTRLTLVKAYRAIKLVRPTLIAATSETGISTAAVDKQNTAGAGNGPLIKVFDAAGAVVAGHDDIKITGY